MEKSITKKIVAILMIIIILSTDFVVLGSSMIAYAAINSSDIEFSAYFEDGDTEVTQSIKNEDLSLYVEVKVNGDGYLTGGAIEIANSNFNIKNDILPSNTYIESIDGNKVNLKQINEGETAIIELGIEPKISDIIKSTMLSEESTLKLSGTYMEESYEGITVAEESIVRVNYQPDESAVAELEADIITNKVLSVDGVNKRIVQLLIKSKLAENQYPVEQTTLNVTIPGLSEELPEVSVLALGKLATNGATEIRESDYTITENGLQIILKNERNTAGEINWVKNACDEMVVTFMYAEDVDASIFEINTDSKIRLYNLDKQYTQIDTATNENQEPNSVIMSKTEITTEELYKGKLYANLDTEYETKTTLVVTNADVAEEIVVIEGPDVFGTAESELDANTKYVESEINLEKVLALFGQDGNIAIKNGEIITLINKDTQVDEKGNIVIDHGDGVSRLEITTSKPVNTGTLEIKHTKLIVANTYTRNELQTIETLKTVNSVMGTVTVNKEKQKVIENFAKPAILELKETVSKAELIIENNKEKLSTTESNDLTLGITLVTDGTQYDLYKNPRISIQFPSAVESVELNETLTKQNADEFTINGYYDSKIKTYKITLTGEQTEYPESSLTQAYLQLNFKISLSELATSQEDKIIMSYINENATQYDGGMTDVGVIEKSIQIEAPNTVITMFNLSSNENTSLTETILQRIRDNDAGSRLDFGITLINNEDSEINNVRILGKLPTTENVINEQEVNTLETILKEISAENATIYYTENVNATTDVENVTNGWTTELLSNAKLYLIKLDSLSKSAHYDATVTVQIPTSITPSALSYTAYEVMYDTNTETNVKVSSRKIGLMSSLAATLETEITAQVGQDVISNGSSVKEGEVIKYTVTVKNAGRETLNNVKLRGEIPTGTILVKPIEGEYTLEDGTIEDGGYVYVPNAYYEEITDSEKIAEIISTTISELAPGANSKIEYEVRVNKGIEGTVIANKAVAEYDGSTKESAELKNKITEGNVRVTIKRTIDESVRLFQGGTTRYTVYVENLSNSTINNLGMQILSDAFSVESIENDNIFLNSEEISEKIVIAEIPANGIEYFSIYGSIKDDAIEMTTSVIVNDANGNIYRSNALKETFSNIDATISLTSPQNGKYISEGDIVEYNVIVKNTGEIESNVTIEDIIPSYLQVQSISIDGNIIRQSTDVTGGNTYFETIANNIHDGTALQPGENAQINIITKVKYIPELHHGNVITNYATVKVFDIVQNTSQKVSHVLKSSSMQDESVANVINGFAWFDSNENGKRDSEEEVLAGINVKLYNLTSGHYVVDNSGNIVETITDSNGEYTFTKIANGSYLIVFEYDTKAYEPTTSYADGVDTSINSKAVLKDLNGKTITVIEINELTGNIFDMNLGLKENLTPDDDTGASEEPGNDDGSQGGNTENPGDGNTETPGGDNENPGNTDKPNEPVEDKKTISGLAWLDSNRNGQKDTTDIVLSGIKAKLYDVSTKNYIVETVTDSNGKYEFDKIEKGSYIVIFEYDTEEYEPTTYCAEGVDTTVNSKVVIKKITIDGQEITVAVTDTINVQENVTNINIGLKEKLIFDLELNKYISRIVVQTSKETKAYDYVDDTFEKVEIHRKQIVGSLVVLEYTIKVKNTGEMSGYAKNIVDYLPAGLTFSSELNSDWYLSGSNLYTKSLENVELAPGEEKEVKLILTKTMTEQNTGLINNRAEIYQDYNKYGEADIDSTPNNQAQKEDDMGSVDVIIMVATGGDSTAYAILLMINVVLIGIAIRLMIKNGIIQLPTKKKERR